jgi:RNA polymerase sigma-70 factor (ECF subfamily)
MVAPDAPDADVAALIGGSAEAFGRLADPYRRQLLVHCYRMLGSIDDAEDAVQEALARAWHGRNTFQRAISLRAWLYRIATNTCLDAIERRKRSLAGEKSLGVVPIPEDLLDEVSEGPEARYDSHESVSLAFLTALQLLPPRQRAVLILRDVLSWRAAEVAELLDLTAAAVNSALHRARTTVSRQAPPAHGVVARPSIGDPDMRSLLDRYVQAWEAADVAGLVALLRYDAVVLMPPGLTVTGARAIGAFLASSVFGVASRIRLTPVRTNGGLAHVLYSGSGAGTRAGPASVSDSDTRLRAYAVLLVDVDAASIVRISAYADRDVIARFGLPEELGA